MDRERAWPLRLPESATPPQASTSFVINVSPDAAHAEETRCSLEFGERIGVVRNTATRVVGQDVLREACGARERLRGARAALTRLEAEGHGGRFGGQAHEVAMFKENIERFVREDRAARQANSSVTELKAAAVDAGRIAEAEARARAHAAEAANYRDIVLRQNSIAGLYTPPKPAYLAKAAMVRVLEADLEQLGITDDEAGGQDNALNDAELAGALASALAAYRR